MYIRAQQLTWLRWRARLPHLLDILEDIPVSFSEIIPKFVKFFPKSFLSLLISYSFFFHSVEVRYSICGILRVRVWRNDSDAYMSRGVLRSSSWEWTDQFRAISTCGDVDGCLSGSCLVVRGLH